MHNLSPSVDPGWLDTQDIRDCAFCPRFWQLRRRLDLDRTSTGELVKQIRRLRRSADREQRALAATYAAEVYRRKRQRCDDTARAARLGVPISRRAVLASLAGTTLVAAVGLWCVGWVPALAYGPPGRIVGLFGPPLLGAAACWQVWRARRHLRPHGAVVYLNGPGFAAGQWLCDAELRLRGRPDRVVRGMNGGLVVQQYPPHLMSVRVNPQDAAEGAALAVLVERVLGEACQGIEVHSTDGMHALPVGAGARDSVATLLAYMREIDGDAVVAPARADRSCAGCGMRLLCPEGQGGAAGR